jgi:uncharacterized protein (DUF1800 family)
MTSLPRRIAAATLAAAAVAALAAAPSAHTAAPDETRIVHALNRLAFGPRPGDVEAVAKIGLDRWIARQLEPGSIDDEALAKRLAAYKTLSLSTGELLAKYEVPPDVRRRIQQELAQDAAMDPESPEARRERRALVAKYAPQMEGSPRQVVEELQAAKLTRAVHSERQLDEVLADFWINHFNVDANKGPVKFLLADYERTIREHAWGRFEELLLATAESPAMLFYLDNWLSSDPEAAERLRSAMRGRGRFGRTRQALTQAPQRRSGLNENYARELMELHTLGVDGGYTQQDVTELARCLTGWTIRGLRENDPRFAFEERLHVPGDKTVLGQRIPGGGKGEAERVIRMLARHPSTARFIATKLARRLVADEPPESLVARAAATFTRTDGHIREVVRTIVESPEFWAAGAAKVKTPFEFVVSAARAVGASVDDARPMARRMVEMGMPLYQQQPPTGYKDTADAWVSTSGLLARLNFSLDLAAGRVPGASVDVQSLAPGSSDADELASALAAALVPGGLSEASRATLVEKAGSKPNAPRVAGLLLGSPEFQRR